MQTITIPDEAEIRRIVREEVAARLTALAPEPEPSDWLTVPEAARALGVSVPTVYRRCNEGVLPTRKIGVMWRIHRSAVEKG